MKRVLFLLLVSVFMLPAFHSEAQVQGTQTPTHYQELTKQQQRQVKRDLRKKAREVANQQAFNAAVDALKDRNWVLMASTLYGPRGSAIPVSDNTNFIQFKGNTVYVQLAFNGIAGPNGLGGITVQGTPSQITQVVVNLSAGSNYANATVYPMMNGNNLTFSGTLVPTSQSGIFRSGFISY